MKKYSVSISPGHSNLARGYYSKKYNLYEHNEAVKVANYLKEFLDYSGVFETYMCLGRLRDKVKCVNNTGADIALDLHFNAATIESASGIEVLHSGSSLSMLLADKIQNQLVEFLELRNRGIKKGYYLGDENNPMLFFLAATKMPAVVVESLFMSNDDDIQFLLQNRHKYIASAIYYGILDYFEDLYKNNIVNLEKSDEQQKPIH